MTANKPMTGEQLDELMTVAVNMQRDSEANQNRPSALFAYAVQVAVMELRKVRDDAAALAAENVALLNPETWIEKSAEGEIASAIAHGNGESEESSLLAGMKAIIDSIETPATDAWLAEVRAQGVEMFAKEMHADISEADAIEFAAQLRQGGAAQ